MDLFLINLEDKEAGAIFQKQIQHEAYISAYNSIMKNFYKKEGALKKAENGKPYIENSDLKISISHSNCIVALAFDTGEIGVDIEFLKKRDYKKILKYLKVEKEIKTEEDFYRFWTAYEAEYKSKLKARLLSFSYKNYICTVSYQKEDALHVYEINAPYFLKIKNAANMIKIKPIR